MTENEMLLAVLSEADHAEGWDVDPTGDLIAPCGDLIEQDGECSCEEHHVSPLRLLGLI